MKVMELQKKRSAKRLKHTIVMKELYKYEDKKTKQIFAKSYRLLNCINILLTVDLTMKKKNIILTLS